MASRLSAVQSIDEITVNWNDFYELIVSRNGRVLETGFVIRVFDDPEGSYLQMVDSCQDAFERYPSFAAMPDDLRKIVAGFTGTGRYFGNMGLSGQFMRTVNQAPELIARSLDLIPLEGELVPALIEKCMTSMFEIQGIDIGGTTRFLTVKRPDLFLPVNGGNRPQIRQVFGSR